MSENERARIFEWLQKNPYYAESLEKEEDTKIFHARFDPDNQYEIVTEFEGKIETNRAFKMGEYFYLTTRTLINYEYIKEIKKLDRL